MNAKKSIAVQSQTIIIDEWSSVSRVMGGKGYFSESAGRVFVKCTCLKLIFLSSDVL